MPGRGIGHVPRSYPYSYSLLFLLIWAAAYALLYRSQTGNRTALVLGALVLSHWLLDCVTHRPDMPLYPGSPEVGVGLRHGGRIAIARSGSKIA